MISAKPGEWEWQSASAVYLSGPELNSQGVAGRGPDGLNCLDPDQSQGLMFGIAWKGN